MDNLLAHPSLRTLPDWVTELRSQQVEAIERVLCAYQEGVKVVVLDAPTGSGKTLIAECIRRLLGTSALYICNNKSLQDQFLRDYDYASVLKGRANYVPVLNPDLTCDDCLKNTNKSKFCPWCPSVKECPYERAKQDAIRSEIAVLNTSYFLTEANNIGRFSQRPFAIADEADTLESLLMGHISVGVSEGRMKRYGWQGPSKVTVSDSWVEWIENVLPDLDRRGKRLVDHVADDISKHRELRYILRLEESLNTVRKSLVTDPTTWVLDVKKNERRVSFKPSRVDSFGQDLLWRHSDRWLLMSATIISPKEMLDSLGYTGDYMTVSIGSSFPKENRPVRVWSVGAVSHKNKEALYPVLGARVREIVEKHQDKVLVHTVSYDLTRSIYNSLTNSLDHVGRPIYTYANASARPLAEEGFRTSTNGVLVAPSMDRGVDLPDDNCRIQVICKVPYPYLGDKQVSARLYSPGGQVWYTVQTVRTIVQMAGRAVRNDDDWAITYILDGSFEKLWNSYRSLFPMHFREAVVFDGR